MFFGSTTEYKPACIIYKEQRFFHLTILEVRGQGATSDEGLLAGHHMAGGQELAFSLSTS